MGEENQTSANEFIILGFFDLPHLQVPLFVSFLLIYFLTLIANLLIMVIVYSNTQLHTPMYFFLTNLAFVDITQTTIIFPNMLAHFFQKGTPISMTGCLLQMYFFITMVSTELLLLGVMAYDRYQAICNPLRYTTIMNNVKCITLAALSWIVGLMDAIPHIVQIAGLSFCGSHKINHFFCDVTAVMKLACSSTRSLEELSYIIGVIVGLIPFVLTIASYISIISTILKIQSTEGRNKAFSTCASHLSVVILFYGVICSTYMRPTSTYSIKDNKLLSLSYVAVTPLCNPIIYSLKNTEFRKNLKKTKITG
ncbi:olfactory receptor 5V1-like [Lissotriton helveticus]